MGRSRHGIIGPDDPTISYFTEVYSAFNRFIKEHIDSLQPHKMNRYMYCNNNPINFIDPLGYYEIDVHLDRSFAIYVAAGESIERAKQIAFGNQYTDDSPRTTSMTLNEAQRRREHFADAKRIQEKYDIARESPDNPYLLGSADHTRQDSKYAHADYLDDASHLSEGSWPDKTYNPNSQAMASAEEDFKRAYERNHPNGTPDEWRQEWQKIKPHIQKHSEAQTDEEKWEALRKIVNTSFSALRQEYQEWSRQEIRKERAEIARERKIPRIKSQREVVVDQIDGRVREREETK